MLNLIIYIVYGIAFGIATVIPGLSGATVAVIMGYYEKLIVAVSEVFTEFKKHILFIIFFGMGVLIGIFLFALLIKLLLDVSQIGICFVFMGLVIGSIPSVYSKSNIKVKKISVWEIAAFVFAAGLICFLALYSGGSVVPLMTDSVINIFNLFLVGFICALGPVTPGVSGSMLLIILAGMSGYNQILAAVTDWNILMLLPFGIGMVLGAFLLSILIRTCINRARKTTYAFILGLVVFSFLPLYTSAGVGDFNLEVIISIIIAVAVGIGTYFFTRKMNNKIGRVSKNS